jgi:hypothetical protein
MAETIFGKTIRSILGTTNSITAENDKYQFYYDLVTRIQGIDTIFAASIDIRRSQSLRLGLYYSTSLIEFKMEAEISVLLNSPSNEKINIAMQLIQTGGDNSTRATRIIGKASKIGNNTRWEVADFTSSADNAEPPIRLDPIITNEIFRDNSSKQAGPVNVSYRFSDESLKLSGSIIEPNENTAIIGFLAVSSVESTYNISFADSVVSGTWK